MASTYSPSLRIELIGAGDQTGVWNITTNRNLGTLIDTAIAGNTAVSVAAANQALTAVNGYTDEARQSVLTLTTTTTAAFAIYAPPAPKEYIVHNTSAYTATIYNSTTIGNTTAAGAGVAIPAGGKVTVFSNGSSFFATDATSFSGVLPVVNGGTGVATKTGTGSAVLNTSPALTTPTLTGYTETVFTITDSASVDINPANGTIQLWTLGTNRTPTATSFAAGQSITLMIADGAAYQVTWTTMGVVWANTTIPTLPTTGYAVIVLWKVGTTLYGSSAGSVA
jgi:hypothetical protein